MNWKLIHLLILLAVCSCMIALPVAAETDNSALPSPLISGDNYIAVFSWDGKLEETFNYRVTSLSNFTMLYRYFNAPLVTEYIPYLILNFLAFIPPMERLLI